MTPWCALGIGDQGSDSSVWPECRPDTVVLLSRWGGTGCGFATYVGGLGANHTLQASIYRELLPTSTACAALPRTAQWNDHDPQCSGVGLGGLGRAGPCLHAC
jgi:hypothetical protein